MLLEKIAHSFELDEDTRISLISFILKGYTFLGMGKDRMTWLAPNGRYVLKFPRWESGIGANNYEARTWKDSLRNPDPDGPVYAPCRLLRNGALMMWAARNLQGGTNGCQSARERGLGGNDYYEEWDNGELPEDFPPWVYDVDCCQVGILRNGRLAAYDYGG